LIFTMRICAPGGKTQKCKHILALTATPEVLTLRVKKWVSTLVNWDFFCLSNLGSSSNTFVLSSHFSNGDKSCRFLSLFNFLLFVRMEWRHSNFLHMGLVPRSPEVFIIPTNRS
jgi:hypothetical protein